MVQFAVDLLVLAVLPAVDLVGQQVLVVLVVEVHLV